MEHMTGAGASENTDLTLIQKYFACFAVVPLHARPFFVFFCFGHVLLLLLASPVIPVAGDLVVSQLALACATFAAIRLLSDHPPLNPIQAFVLLFHWWFSVGPICCTFYYWISGDRTQLEAYARHPASVVWVVACGLPLYGIAARIAVRFIERRRWHARFLMPAGPLYHPGTIIAFTAFALAIRAVLQLFAMVGAVPFDTLNYFGGQQVQSTPLAILASAMRVSEFAFVGLLGYLTCPAGTAQGRSFKYLAVLVGVASMASAVSSGWKGAFVFPVFYLILLILVWRQRLPWIVLCATAIFFILLVEPFVATARQTAEQLQINTPEERSAVFLARLRDVPSLVPTWRTVNIESPFRGIYQSAVSVASMSSAWHGPWDGQSLRDGLSAIVPRALSPEKQPSNMGNFFARQLGATEGDLHSIAITIPFEFVGNYGFVAGILSFALIGLLWGAFTCGLVSAGRLATHPLSPVLIVLLLAVESSVGQFVNQVKMLMFPLALVYLVWRMRGRVL